MGQSHYGSSLQLFVGPKLNKKIIIKKGFWIPSAAFRTPKPSISDSTSKIFLDFGR